MFLSSQNGGSDVETVFDRENPRFIRNGRDLATIAFRDVLYTEAFRAALILFVQGTLGGSVGPYAVSSRQQGFATFGEPHILTAMAASSSSTRHAWYAKVCPSCDIRGPGSQSQRAIEPNDNHDDPRCSVLRKR